MSELVWHLIEAGGWCTTGMRWGGPIPDLEQRKGSPLRFRRSCEYIKLCCAVLCCAHVPHFVFLVYHFWVTYASMLCCAIFSTANMQFCRSQYILPPREGGGRMGVTILHFRVSLTFSAHPVMEDPLFKWLRESTFFGTLLNRSG